MEESTQTTGSYSTSGKLFRGFLCMLTFCVFIAGFAISVYSIAYFGEDIITDPKSNYFDSSTYQSDINSEMQNVIYDLSNMHNYMYAQDLSVIDIGSGTRYYYDVAAMMEAYSAGTLVGDSLSDLSSYVISKESLEIDFYDLSAARSYFVTESAKGSYIYFDKKAFINLFIREGLQNTNYRFSDKFSEDSYFVFDDENERMKQQGIYSENDINYIWESYESDEVAGATIESIYNYDSDIKYDLTNVGYAVYNPEENIFYSTWDDYFDIYDNYMYSAEEVNEAAKQNKVTPSRTNSLLFPVLWSYNYAQDNFARHFCDNYNVYLDAVNSLNRIQNSGLVYNCTCKEFNYSNAEVEDITKSERIYQLCGSEVTPDEALVKNTKDLANYLYISEAFGNLPADTTLYFGIDTHRDVDEISRITTNEKIYITYAKWNKWAIVVAAIAFILLMFQAGFLIRTTGRNSKTDQEVHLNVFDKLPTEIWLLITTIGLGSPIFIGIEVLQRVAIPKSPVILVGFVIAQTLPFAFLFMIFVLSFARRLKGHNLWSKLFLRKVWHSIVMGIKAFLQSRKGREKLIVCFVIYVLLQAVLFIFVLTKNISEQLAMLFFIVLQVVVCLLMLYVIKDIRNLTNGIREITKGNLDYKTQVNDNISIFKEISDGINHIGDGLKNAVETSLKDERMKTELITNVSHDLKTPLTSIINYIDLLKNEPVQTEEAEHYLEVLEAKAQRLKHLTEDLVEAAKANTGNIELEKMPLAFDELMKQAVGEFEDKFALKNLEVVAHYPNDTAVILADGRRLFRIVENVLQNAYKYAMPGTRIYADLSNSQSVITFTLKNVSAAPLNISADELMERFTRGDSARTTEGSGLGLSIAKDLTRLQEGTFDIMLDGDLFKVIITFPEYKKPEVEEILEEEIIEEDPAETSQP